MLKKHPFLRESPCVPIIAAGNYVGTWLTPFNPFALLVGLAFDIFFVLHGTIFLSLRETGVLVKRAQRVVPLIWGVNLLVIALVVITGVTATNVFKQALLNPRVVPLDYVILASLVTLLWLNARGRSGWAFDMSFVVIICSAIIVVMCLFPNVMVSSLSSAWSLTIRNASTNPYSLTVISWIGLTIIPFVMLYQAWNYWVFRKRIEPHAIGHY